jgi:predicted ATP-dependent endonuclease of OLD family
VLRENINVGGLTKLENEVLSILSWVPQLNAGLLRNTIIPKHRIDEAEFARIVDQPEENLDSQTVYRPLIPVIKDVKNRRQIIMVTHSPNIAVVCDAEQIIHALSPSSTVTIVPLFLSRSLASTPPCPIERSAFLIRTRALDTGGPLAIAFAQSVISFSLSK